ncbi:TetR/AcrR family transcriptional regulator [Paenibacillus sp. N1-5-1-14]|uniref:TetR/AcrR family transcriptional regulator n=1 Tax=Paenibacillus radicibacter TaxID=2972488 RepID=UPI0021591BE9|nr:helix-turn-helix domain-containing protein [Paenibacillus radicibacter]MCR8645935.1 TetR/AcrR family transcriptional regulator [Paenibacillus radicibacter]
MPRNKYPERTEKKILEVSRELFFQKGYDETTMQDILDKGLSKGAIYHHFKSKREIFERIMQNIEGGAPSISPKTDSLNSLEQLKFILSQRLEDKERIKLLKKAQSLFEDPKVFGELYQINMNFSADKMKEFINAGNKDNSMKCQYIQGTAELITQFFSIWMGTSLYNVSEDDFYNKLDYYKMLFECSGVSLIDSDLYSKLTDYYKELVQAT